ncbi:hypothetical protein EVAR_36343_1 [Eumeta japonica]|uniref:Uncharacterized protein n=1 Tax=Eumeta variegata TaxID=151549 RepID=A0A4C1W877_EUMVA|nr:hypothetical protein EVAR_36343_1 [Eumeta japonica]
MRVPNVPKEVLAPKNNVVFPQIGNRASHDYDAVVKSKFCLKSGDVRQRRGSKINGVRRHKHCDTRPKTTRTLILVSCRSRHEPTGGAPECTAHIGFILDVQPKTIHVFEKRRCSCAVAPYGTQTPLRCEY